MGLDMYLMLKINAANYAHDPAGQELTEAIVKALGLPSAEPFEHGMVTISLPVGYWRKANAIHRWFVENVQGGEDNCQESHVNAEKLKELSELCKSVLLVPGIADEKLPTGTSFFFGSDSTSDEWYLQTLRNTVEIIDKALAVNETVKGSLCYQASW